MEKPPTPPQPPEHTSSASLAFPTNEVVSGSGKVYYGQTGGGDGGGGEGDDSDDATHDVPRSDAAPHNKPPRPRAPAPLGPPPAFRSPGAITPVLLGVPSLNIGAILAERENVEPGKYDVTFDADGGSTSRTDFTDATDATLGNSTYRARGDVSNR